MPDAQPDAQSNCSAVARANAHSDCGADAQSNCSANTSTNAHSDSGTDPSTDCGADAQSDCNAVARAHACAHSRTNCSANKCTLTCTLVRSEPGDLRQHSTRACRCWLQNRPGRLHQSQL